MPAGHEHVCCKVKGSWGACHVSSCFWALVFLLTLALLGFAEPLQGTTCLTLLLHPSCSCHLLLAMVAAWQSCVPAPAVTVGREGSHALCMQLGPDDEPAYVPIRRGDITVHDERVAHGSGPNLTDQWRKAYVIAYR